MAKQEFTNHPSGLHDSEGSGNGSAIGPVETLGSYLELVEQCMDAVQKMPCRNFNNEQCQYLANKLQMAVQSARSFFEVFRAQFNETGISEDIGRCFELFKLLVALSKQIESFIQGCCKNAQWIQAAMTLTNVSEYVSSLGFNLELCGVIFGKGHTASRLLTPNEVADLHKSEVKVVKRKASADLDTLVAKVTHSLTENSLSNDEKKLCAYLLQRLHGVRPIQHSNSSESIWRSIINEEGNVLGKLLINWVTMEKLGKGASGTVHKVMWLGMPVAKKRFSVKFEGDFERESKILAGLCHPNITSMFAQVEHERNCSIIMELMDEDLHELIQRRCETRVPPFTLSEAVDIMLQVGEAGFVSNLAMEEPLPTEMALFHEDDDQGLSLTSKNNNQTVQECLKHISSIEHCTGILHFNHLLCERFVSKYLHRARELLEERKDKIELYSEQCAPPLIALFNTVKEAKFLIQKHCTSPSSCTSSSSWMKAAIELVGNTSAFAEVILDLKWYMYALKIALKAASVGIPHQKVDHLQSLAMVDYGNFPESWERDCKQLRLDWDCEALLSRLKTDTGKGIRTLPSYLAEKLELDMSMHVSGAFAVNLKADEFMHKKVLLGSGSLGKVYKVRWLGMPCALKEIDGKTDIDEEVKVLSRLLHPNIVQLYGYFLEQGKLYLVMERMHKTLSEYMETKEWRNLQESPFFREVVLDCMFQIAKGMCYLHGQGIVHHDLKGDNILVKPSENPELQRKGFLTVKLTDFGLAKTNLRNCSYTSFSPSVDALVWKAPELLRVVQSNFSTSRKRKHYPLKPDVYSFGMVCYELLSGKKPFSDTPISSMNSLFVKVKRGERPELPENTLFSVELTDYIRKCWDTDPFRRPNFVEICKQIRHFRDSLLQIIAYVGWEHKQPLEGQILKAVIQEPSIMDENDFMIDIVGDWSWEIDYADIVVESDKPISTGSGFESVWCTHLKNSNQPMLAKHIKTTLIETDGSIAKFKHEIGLLMRKQHENLVSYLGATSQAPFVVFTEFVNGVTLRKFSRNKTLSSKEDPILARRHRFREEVDIALQVARGLQFLHEGQDPIIHGELSPDCILIDENTMTAKIADFGLQSFRIAPKKWQPRWYRRAPEQHQPGLSLHTSADVFLFGAILHDLFEPEKAQHFWKKRKPSTILEEGGRPELDLASAYPRGLKALIERCWVQNPEERPNFELIISELEKMASQLSRSKFIQGKFREMDKGDLSA